MPTRARRHPHPLREPTATFNGDEGQISMKITAWLTHDELSCFNLSASQANRLRAALPQVDLYVARSETEFLAHLPESRGALVWRFEQNWLESATDLEWLVTPAAGRDYFHIEPREGLTIEYCSFHGELIAETVVGMLLMHARGLRRIDQMRQYAEWPRKQAAEMMRPLRGSHVAILGFGNIGQWIAKLLKAVGVRITGVRRSRSEPPPFFDVDDRVIAIEDLDGELPGVDYLVVALPGGPETDHIVHRGRLELLPSHAVVVNVGRGNAIDTAALVAALENESIDAAYLDVFEEEPLPGDSELIGCYDAFISPHSAAFSPNYLTLFVDEVVEKFQQRYG
jgi:phosphoglycerate dehydrogenase-like enzyme